MATVNVGDSDIISRHVICGGYYHLDKIISRMNKRSILKVALLEEVKLLKC